VLKKKELYRKRGKEDIPLDSKFTARKRKPRF
jgi:18S rRNA (guanine1575-N7)-methyltransferase